MLAGNPQKHHLHSENDNRRTCHTDHFGLTPSRAARAFLACCCDSSQASWLLGRTDWRACMISCRSRLSLGGGNRIWPLVRSKKVISVSSILKEAMADGSTRFLLMVTWDQGGSFLTAMTQASAKFMGVNGHCSFCYLCRRLTRGCSGGPGRRVHQLPQPPPPTYPTPPVPITPS